MTDIHTEDRVATLHALLNDSAVKIGEQRLVIKELREALELIANRSTTISVDPHGLAQFARAALKAKGVS